MSSGSGLPSIRKPEEREPIVVLVVVAIAILLVLSALAYRSTTSSQPSTGPIADGPTFYQAIAAVNGSVAAQPGGPWTLYAVWGVATPIPFSPDSLGWSSYNETVNSCGAQFNGLTLWNGSIPLFNGSFNSGTAPFWQFGFFSNASQSILLATDVLGVPRTYPLMSMSSPCADGTGLGATPWIWANILSPFPANSPVMAASAWEAIGARWTTANQPGYEVYVLGFSDWGSGNPSGLIVRFARCGEVGATGVQPEVNVILNGNGTWNSYFNGTQGCGDVISRGPPPVYGGFVVDFASPNVSHGTGTIVVNQSFQVTYGNRSADSDAGGLVSWMATLNVTNSGGQRLPSLTPGCGNWVSSLGECSPDGAGWYAVLLSSSGSWLDAYPSSPNGTDWEIPNVALASNQFLAVVVPSTWNPAGDVLSINGTVSLVVVSGSVTL
jgi:hypothetical protein